MGEILFVVGGTAVTVAQALVGLAALALLVLIVLAIMLARGARARSRGEAAEAVRQRLLDERMDALGKIQAETIGSVRAMNEAITGRQAELARVVGDSLASVSHRLNQSLSDTTQQTMERLHGLHERLALIDNAQK